MKTLRFKNLRPLILVVVSTLLLNCSAARVDLGAIQAEAEKKYPVPPEPPKSIDTPSPTMPDIPEPSSDATEDERRRFELRLAEIKNEYQRNKINWNAAKRRIEAQYSAWQKDRAWAIQKQEDYINLRKPSFTEHSTTEFCIGAFLITGAVTGLITLLVTKIKPLYNLPIN